MKYPPESSCAIWCYKTKNKIIILLMNFNSHCLFNIELNSLLDRLQRNTLNNAPLFFKIFHLNQLNWVKYAVSQAFVFCKWKKKQQQKQTWHLQFIRMKVQLNARRIRIITNSNEILVSIEFKWSCWDEPLAKLVPLDSVCLFIISQWLCKNHGNKKRKKTYTAASDDN